MSKTVSTKLARQVLKAAQSQGYNTQELIKTVGLDFDPLTVNVSQQPDFIPASVYNQLYKRVIWLLQDEAFGLHLKQRVPAGSFRMMCMCIAGCSTLGSAIERATEFMNFCRVLGGLAPIQFTAIRADGDFVISQIPSNDELFSLASEDNLSGIIAYLHIWRQLLSWLIDCPLDVARAHLTIDSPQRIDAYEEILSCPLTFNSDCIGISFRKEYLDYPVNHDERSLNEFLRSAPYQLTQSNKRDANDIINQMRIIVGTDFGKEFPSIEELAKHLNLSVRTLRRRLNEQGSNYQTMKDEIRKDAACRFLARPELKITTVAALMGFDEPSTFHRSFKKWAGMTPGEYRQTLDTNNK